MRLIDAQHIRSSNLQLTKFIAAIMVIISHSFLFYVQALFQGTGFIESVMVN